MNNDYITQEVDKIMSNKDFPYPQNMAMAITWMLGNLKGINLKVLDVQERSSLTDYFVMASATNTIQAHSMADLILGQMKRHKHPHLSKEGARDTDWVLLDLNDVIVHIFLERARDFYNLDKLWEEVPSIDIPHSYYMSSEEDESIPPASPSGDPDKNYF